MSSCDNPIVEVKQGKLKGKIEKNYKGGSYSAFYGVPFAQPPTGNLRFKGPKPPLSWNGIRDALVDGDACRSRHMATLEFIGSEDCLYVNIFTPQLPPVPKLKPVLFFIHGGSFVIGSNSAEYYGGERILSEDVVLVTTNYRLGALGALGFKNPELDTPGNNGLKDCIASLKWVKENIEKFGGDPLNVTIFGESAGSAICHYLVLLPAAKGLFHRAILQSGTVTCPWAFNEVNHPELLAKALGYTGNDDDEKSIYEFLLTVPVEKLAVAQEVVDGMEGYKSGILPWAPVREVTGCPTETSILTQHPLEIIKSGKFNDVPIIFGYNSDEGLLMCSKLVPPIIKNIMSTTNNEDFHLGAFGVKRGSPESVQLGNMIKQFYYADKTPSTEEYKPYVDYCTDVFFLTQVVVAAQLHAAISKQPIYLYRFAVDLPYCKMKELFGIPYRGTCHADELFYLFSNTLVVPPIDNDAAKTIHALVKIWTNFGITGQANLKNADSLLNYNWQPITSDKNNLLNIGLEVESKDVLPEAERVAFWSSLLKKVGK